MKQIMRHLLLRGVKLQPACRQWRRRPTLMNYRVNNARVNHPIWLPKSTLLYPQLKPLPIRLQKGGQHVDLSKPAGPRNACRPTAQFIAWHELASQEKRVGMGGFSVPKRLQDWYGKKNRNEKSLCERLRSQSLMNLWMVVCNLAQF